jgi:hypothetical protein
MFHNELLVQCAFSLQEIVASLTELSQQPRPELFAKKLFPNRKTLLSGKKSSPTAQNPRIDGKVRPLAKGFFPNSIPFGKEKLLAKPRRG